MSQLKITALVIEKLPRQKIEIPVYAKFLTAEVDVRFDKHLLWFAYDSDNEEKKEKVEIITVYGENEVTPVCAKYVATIKTNAGRAFIFSSCERDNPMVKIE